MLNNSLNDQAHARGAAARTHLLSVASQPVWNIVGGAINAVEGHLFGPPLSFWLDDEDDDASPTGYTVTDSGIAIVPVHGTLVDSEPSWWMSYLGYCSIPQIARSVTAAGADLAVKDILLDVKSPGGHVSGLAAACDAVWAVRQGGDKRIWAACSQVCSAAYEIASQCEKMYLSPDGMGGCIGTLYLLSDWSGYYTQMGVVKLRVASDGADTYKGAGAMGTKITPAQLADYKRMCNEYRSLFNGIIQRGRGFSDATMLALADGRVHIGANALQLSLVDGIATPEAVLSALGGGDDLDDLAGPPAQQEDDDDDDGDEDPTDLSMENNPLSNKIHTDGKPQNADPSGRVNGFLAWLRGDDAANEAPAPQMSNGKPAQSDDAHPVLQAALAAGLDTPEKLNALIAERNARQEADKTSAQQALTAAREAAQNAAVTAFGQETPQLKEAQAAIAAQDNVAALGALTSAYKAVRPSTLKAGTGRQTKAEQTQTSDDAPNTTAANENLNPGTVYAKRRAAR